MNMLILPVLALSALGSALAYGFGGPAAPWEKKAQEEAHYRSERHGDYPLWDGRRDRDERRYAQREEGGYYQRPNNADDILTRDASIRDREHGWGPLRGIERGLGGLVSGLTGGFQRSSHEEYEDIEGRPRGYYAQPRYYQRQSYVPYQQYRPRPRTVAYFVSKSHVRNGWADCETRTIWRSENNRIVWRHTSGPGGWSERDERELQQAFLLYMGGSLR